MPDNVELTYSSAPIRKRPIGKCIARTFFGALLACVTLLFVVGACVNCMTVALIDSDGSINGNGAGVMLSAMAATVAGIFAVLLLKNADPQVHLPDAAVIRAPFSRLSRLSVVAAIAFMLFCIFFLFIHHWMDRANLLYLHLPWSLDRRIRGLIFVALAVAAIGLPVSELVVAFCRRQRRRGFLLAILALCSTILSLGILSTTARLNEGRATAARTERQRLIVDASSLARYCASFVSGSHHWPASTDELIGTALPAKGRNEEFTAWVNDAQALRYLAADLPVAPSPPRDLMIFASPTLAPDTRQLFFNPSTGAIDYAHEGYLVIYADQRVEVIFLPRWPARWNAHNAARASLGLPPQPDPTSTR